LSKSLSLEGLFATLASFEEKSLAKTIQKGYLAGLKKSNVKHIAPNISIHKECATFIMNMEVPLHICSVHWSSQLIEEVLAFNNIPTKNIKIFSNNLEYSPDDISTGGIIQHCISAQNKLEYLQKNMISPSVYIGDSETDLLAVQKADIGILMHPSSICSRICEHFELNLHEIAKLKETPYDPKSIYLSMSWLDINDVFF